MSTDTVPSDGALSPFEQLRFAREIIQSEGRALATLADHLDVEFCRAIDLLYHSKGSVIVTGMGKAGLIGQKISATLASTGTRSHVLHPSEACHGDLGRVHRDDVMVVLSQSGETEEVVQLLPSLELFGLPIIAITGHSNNTLAQRADVTLEIGSPPEACSLGLAPSTSTTAMLAIGDALALVTSRMHNFQTEDFARFHPGGNLGWQLSKVDDHMRPLADCRVTHDSDTVRVAMVACTKPGRRTGAIMLTDAQGRLSGVFTDSDFVRLFEQHRENQIDVPIRNVMTTQPATAAAGASMTQAVEIMVDRKISELPVLDNDGRPVGMLDRTDIARLLPDEEMPAPSPHSEKPAPPSHPATLPYRKPKGA